MCFGGLPLPIPLTANPLILVSHGTPKTIPSLPHENPVLVRRALHVRHRLQTLALARTLFAGVDGGVQFFRRIGVRAAGSLLRSLCRAQPQPELNVASLESPARNPGIRPATDRRTNRL